MTTNQNIQKRVVYADMLRVFATLAVIFLHVSGTRWYNTLGTFEWEVLNVYDSIVRWCVPVFIMLSGMLFLNPDYQVSYDKLFKKSILRIVAALFFWGNAYYASTLKHIFTEPFKIFISEIMGIEKRIIFGPPWYHLWFLYVIIGLYLLVPILKIFIAGAKEKDIRYLLILFPIFGMTIKIFNHFFNSKINMAVPEVSSFMGYFIAGYYFATFDISVKTRNIFYLLGLFSAGFTIWVTHYLSHKDGVANSFFYDYIMPNAMFMAYAIFIFFRNLKTENFRGNMLLFKVSECCFGIYLVHDFFNMVLRKNHIGTDYFNPAFSLPLAILIFGCSFVFVFIIKKIPVLKHWII